MSLSYLEKLFLYHIVIIKIYIQKLNNMAASKDKVKIEDGVYNSNWTAYNLTILSNEDNSELVTVKTIMGVKGINILEKVEVKNGLVYFCFK